MISSPTNTKRKETLLYIEGMIRSILKINSTDGLEEQLARIVELLNQGGIIGYPTETVYGLGGDAFDPLVVERIHKLKGRDRQKPFLVLVEKREDVVSLKTTFKKSYLELKYPLDEYEKKYNEWEGIMKRLFIKRH